MNAPDDPVTIAARRAIITRQAYRDGAATAREVTNAEAALAAAKRGCPQTTDWPLWQLRWERVTKRGTPIIERCLIGIYREVIPGK